MIETFIIDWPVLMVLGFVFGAFARVERWWRTRAFAAGVVSAVAFTTTAMVSYAIAPHWMWMYFLVPDEVTWAVPLIPIGFLFVYVVSFAAATALRRVGPAVVWAAAGLAVAGEAAVLALTWDRYHRVGTTSQWMNDSAHELFTATPSGPVRTISFLGPIFVLVTGVALAVTIRSARARSADR